MKFEAQRETHMIWKKKIIVFHDPGIPKFERRVATGQQGVMKNTEL